MSKIKVDQIITFGIERDKQIQYELRSEGKFVGSDERPYVGIAEAQIAAHAHIDGFPDTYKKSKDLKFLHFNVR